jgi:DNA-binding Lrp family transcriptional regulator
MVNRVVLDSKDIEILLLLQENPLIKISDIAEVIGLSVSNTSARIDALEVKKEAFQGVRGRLNLDAMQLELHNLLFKVSSKKALEYMEKDFSFKHPYLLYRVRCNGPFPGLYMQFRTPICGLNYLEELAGILKSKGIIDDYYYITRNKEEKDVDIKSSIRSYDTKTGLWKFDWDVWKDGFQNISVEKQPKDPPSESILNQLSELDVKLLSQLLSDARRKNIDMIRNLKLSKESGVAQKVSRRLKYLKENAIADYRVFLKYTDFDLFQTILIQGYCRDEIPLKLRNYLMKSSKEENQKTAKRKSVFPFQCTYFITKEGFYWYVRAPPKHVSEILDFVWEICPDHKLFLLDYRFSRRYPLWPETFDVENHKWKRNYEFMVKSVINGLD